MEWAAAGELGTAYGMAIAWGMVPGALIAIFNSWRA